MTPAHAKVRDSIAALTSGGVAPSMREVARHAGLKSLATVSKAYDHLERAGVIARNRTERRSVVLLDVNAHWHDRVISAMTDAELQDLAERVGEEIWQRREANGGE